MQQLSWTRNPSETETGGGDQALLAQVWLPETFAGLSCAKQPRVSAAATAQSNHVTASLQSAWCESPPGAHLCSALFPSFLAACKASVLESECHVFYCPRFGEKITEALVSWRQKGGVRRADSSRPAPAMFVPCSPSTHTLLRKKPFHPLSQGTIRLKSIIHSPTRRHKGRLGSKHRVCIRGVCKGAPACPVVPRADLHVLSGVASKKLLQAGGDTKIRMQHWRLPNC